ncbi:MAG: hypothetical protein R2710_05345 [Acidimicrobiales bacterium]
MSAAVDMGPIASGRQKVVESDGNADAAQSGPDEALSLTSR